jgi:hypothetical protein
MTMLMSITFLTHSSTRMMEGLEDDHIPDEHWQE